MTFCDKMKQQAGGPTPSNGTAGSDGSPGKSGCGCKGSALEYEPLTAEWFKEYAGIIALIVTLIMIIANR